MSSTAVTTIVKMLESLPVEVVVFQKPRSGKVEGCVAKTGGSLVKVAFVLTELSDRYLIHELQASEHAWRHFLPEVILLNIRWYCRYALSYRNHRRDDAGEGAKRRSYDGISVGAGLCA